MLDSVATAPRNPELRAGPTVSPLPARGAVDPGSPALVASGDAGEETVVDHGTLRDRVDVAAAALPSVQAGRLLVQVPLRPRVDDVVGYLAVLEAGHVALVTADLVADGTVAGPPARTGSIWQPDLLMDGARGVIPGPAAAPTETTPGGPRHRSHPDLALLLSTSGLSLIHI